MFFNGIKLPESVSIALEEDRLVVFVGAGVSCPPPSNLPLFKELASQIQGGKQVSQGKEDQSLGKAFKGGMDVHGLVAEVVANPESKPTDLHMQILRLFGSPEKVRVVTTNFDNHFSTAARRVFRKGRVKEFHAPALPLGDRFTGLVYLHGSAQFDAQSLVLTRQDFGEAYLTRGWASNFLIPLFSCFDVLFVGYSHSDVTMTYLASGLKHPDVKKRWTFIDSKTSESTIEEWEHLDIETIQYPFDEENVLNKHQALTDFWKAWVDRRREGALKTARRVRAIARKLPPDGEEDKQTIAHCLRQKRLAKEFCDAIRHPEWLEWLERNGYFETFFSGRGDADARKPPYEIPLGEFLCAKVRQEYPDFFLGLLRRNQGRFSESFIHIFSWAIREGQTKTADSKFSLWVSILLGVDGGLYTESYLGNFLRACQLPRDLGLALELFERLTTPKLHLIESLVLNHSLESPSDRAVSARKATDLQLEWPDEASFSLLTVWKEDFKPRLSLIAKSLVPIVERQLTRAHLLLFGAKDEQSWSYGRSSWFRGSITRHEQNDHNYALELSILVDILRDSFLSLTATNPTWARVRASEWWASDVPILKRFAVFAWSVDDQYSADERIGWLLTNSLIFRFGFKKEVYDVLKLAYPHSSLKVRKLLLRCIQRENSGRNAKKPDVRVRAYEIFNVLIWLARADESCSLVQDALGEVRDEFPHFRERDYPNLDYRRPKASFIDPSEGFDPKKIISNPAQCYLDDMLSSRNSPSRFDPQLAYLQNLEKLFDLDREWGAAFMEALSEAANIDFDSKKEIWNRTFFAWRDIILSESDWHWLLKVVDGLAAEDALYIGVSDLLPRIWNGKQYMSHDTIDRAAKIVERTWELCSGETDEADNAYKDWLISAMNHVGGRIGFFWIAYCEYLRKVSAKNWRGIPEPLSANMARALISRNRTGTYVRIAAMQHVGVLFQWDPSFAEKHILPLLDWTRDPVVAQQNWTAILCSELRASEKTFNLLLPYYKQCTERCSQLGKEALKGLGGGMAFLALRVIPNPVESRLFKDFLSPLSLEMRATFARSITAQLMVLPEKKRLALWSSWLERYVDLRLRGVPCVLDDSEVKHMAHWPFYLSENFPDMVERVLKMSLKRGYVKGILVTLLNSDFPERFPTISCRFALTLLRSGGHPTYLSEGPPTLLKRLKARIPKASEVREFEKLLFLQGWDGK